MYSTHRTVVLYNRDMTHQSMWRHACTQYYSDLKTKENVFAAQLEYSATC